MKAEQAKLLRERTFEMLKKAHISITPQEKENIEIADFGLNDIENVGIQVVVYVNTERYCAKELVMFPRQMCPEHRHPAIDEKNIGKQETFRCRWGEAYLYTQGEATPNPKAKVPEKYKKFLNIWKEIILRPGDQYTLPPNSWHWFQAGDKGAIISEFSSRSFDETDVWSDPHIARIPKYE
jgi:D-lyxose ketol-isomerase